MWRFMAYLSGFGIYKLLIYKVLHIHIPLRRGMLYPLSYGGAWFPVIVWHKLWRRLVFFVPINQRVQLGAAAIILLKILDGIS
jgi:hypothetical protein